MSPALAGGFLTTAPPGKSPKMESFYREKGGTRELLAKEPGFRPGHLFWGEANGKEFIMQIASSAG